MKSEIKVAMLGMGNMGCKHANHLRKLPGVRIAALCARNREAAQEYNRASGTDYPVYEDFDRMLEAEPFDALYICLPPFAHTGQLEKAARRGVHIFAEKPIALDVQRGAGMVEAVAQGGVKSQMGYHMRFGGAVARLMELVHSGAAGRPTLYSAHFECNSLHKRWWRDVHKSGGQVLEQIIHLYDMALYTMGDAARVAGFADTLCHGDVPDYTAEDTSAVSIRFQNGALGAITGSNCAIPGRWNSGFHIVFENLVADFTDHNHGRLVFTKEENREELLDFDTDVFFAENEYFMAVIRGEKPEIAPIGEGFKGLALTAAALRSSKEGGAAITL
ncbi:MAG: Gfo/Idh/MocA family oxidoreductase [Candidatus Limiplasma sp.]|nr:Gfo/Idh/MocA family oxidoreductase [Candidatus Limiplasma sp.]